MMNTKKPFHFPHLSLVMTNQGSIINFQSYDQLFLPECRRMSVFHSPGSVYWPLLLCIFSFTWAAQLAGYTKRGNSSNPDRTKRCSPVKVAVSVCHLTELGSLVTTLNSSSPSLLHCVSRILEYTTESISSKCLPQNNPHMQMSQFYFRL